MRELFCVNDPKGEHVPHKHKLLVALLLAVTSMVWSNPAQATTVTGLGDSYASGEGADNLSLSVYQGTSATCRRSTYAATRRLANELEASLKFVACAGATTQNVLNGGQFGEGPQVDALSLSDDLVTLVIGGNDIGFAPLLQAFLLGTVTESSPEVVNARTVMTSQLPSRLDAVLAAIKSRIGSGTKVLVSGYPYVPPVSGTVGLECSGFLANAERTLAISIQAQLNGVITAAVARANDTRFTYLDPNGPTSSFAKVDYDIVGQPLRRDACQSLNPNKAFNAVRVMWDGATVGTMGSFHPNVNGQKYYLGLFNSAL